MSACSVDTTESPPDVQTEQRQDALYGLVSGHEVSVDAPWRIEPERYEYVCLKGGPPCTGLRYAAVPITVVFRDAYLDSLHDLQDVQIEELGTTLAPQVVALNGFHEIQRTFGAWTSLSTSRPFDLCRRWRGDDCSNRGIINGTSEWDGVLMYTVRQTVRPGMTVRLRITTNHGTMTVPSPTGFGTVTVPAPRTSGVVSVVMGEPLPRFDERWAYGDLHYHSEGTDNEGESGYGHRATLQTMSALGLDFVFATEHASNSRQFDNLADGVTGPDVLRDMSQARFNVLLSRLNGAGGGNDEVLSVVRRRSATTIAVPQLFLGGEVDVIPEIDATDYFANRVAFGNHKGWPYLSPCIEFPGYENLPMSLDPCSTPMRREDLAVPAFDTVTHAPIANRWFLEDVQGPLAKYFGRQHLLHLPSSPVESGFVASSTTTFGGASRRLQTLLNTEYTQAHKGVTFLAHPVAFASGSDNDRLGPDIIPYSQAQLSDAFQNQDVLGLQLWNEDQRLSSKRSDPYSVDPLDAATGSWSKIDSSGQFQSIHEGMASFDNLLLWSVNPARRQNVPWLTGGQFRKIFLAGGSDAHGDFNFHRDGYLVGLKKVSDIAIGKPRNLVMAATRSRMVPNGTGLVRALAQQDVVTGLRSGQFIATDGPIVRIAVDTNLNGVIDDTDVPMGGDVAWGDSTQPLRVVVEWASTAEFGRLTNIDLVVNAFTNSTGNGMSYAPYRYGVRGWQHSEILRSYSTGGPLLYELEDHYFLDPTSQLHISVPSAEGFSGRRVLMLVPQAFKTGRTFAGSVPCEVCSNPIDVSKQGPDAPPTLPECQNTCPVAGVLDWLNPDALVFRATARTSGLDACVQGLGQCEPRLALTNPIWARYTPFIPIDPPVGR